MKTIPIALQTDYTSRQLATAEALRITRQDGQVFAFTSADEPVTLSGVTYIADGVEVASLVSNLDLSVDTLTLTAVDDGTVFTRADVIGGRWQGAVFALFRYTWAAPGHGIEPLTAGTVGEVQLLQGSVVAELRGLQQYWQQPIGEVTSKTCRNRLGDARCKVALGPYTFAATVTSVTDNQTFAATALTQAADYFGEGVLTWTSGPSLGMAAKVKTHTSGDNLVLTLPMQLTVAVGHTFSVVAGCRKRHARTAANPTGVSDCADKFANVLNFRGQPHLSGFDALTAAPEVSV